MRRLLLLLLSAGLVGCVTAPYDGYPDYGAYAYSPYDPYYYPYYNPYFGPYYDPFYSPYWWGPGFATFGFGFSNGGHHHHGHTGNGMSGMPSSSGGSMGHMNPSHGHMVGRGGMR